MATKTMLVRAWEQMGMRQHLQLSADLVSVLEHTSDAQALRADFCRPVADFPGSTPARTRGRRPAGSGLTR